MWGMSFKPEVVLSRKTYKTVYEVELDIEESEKLIKNEENHIRDLVMITDPRKFMPEDEENPLFWLQREIKDSMDFLNEERYNLFQLYMLRDYFNECKDNDVKPEIEYF